MRVTRVHRLQRSRLLPWLAALVGLAVSVFASLHMLRDQRERQRQEFAAEVRQHTHAIEAAFEADKSMLWAIAGLFNASEEVTRAQFRIFVVPYFDYFHPNRFYRALGWAPRVPAAGRNAYEETVRSQGFLDFQITDRTRDAAGKHVMVPAGQRHEYLPVGYIEPLTPNERLLGYDLVSAPRRRDALYRARDTGKVAATEPIILHEESETRKWLLVCLPIYASKHIPSTVDERRRLLMGFAFGVYHIGNTVEAMVTSHLPKGMSVAVFDGSIISAQTRLYGQVRPAMPLRITERIQVGGRDWLVVWEGSPHFGGRNPGALLWVLMAAGVSLTVLAVVVILLLQASARQAERDAERHRLVLHTSMDGFFLMAFDGKLLEANAAYCDMVGYSREELLSVRITDLEANESPEQVARHIQAIRELGHDRFETKHRRKNGEIVNLEISTSVCQFPGNEFLVVFARDITERKRADEALRESEERFREIVEVASDAVWEIDEEARYTYWSPRVTDILGYATEEIIGKTPFDLMPPEEAKRVADAFAAIAAARQPFVHLENTNLHKDGHEVILETTGAPIFDAEGRFKGYRGVEQDITERKRTEARVAWHTRVQAGLAEVAAQLLSERDIDAVSHVLLGHCQSLTDSATGAVGYVDPADGMMVFPTFLGNVWDECRIPGKTYRLPASEALWARAWREGASVISNDVATDPHSAGTPEGHPIIHRFLAAPAVVDGEVVGTVMLANKADEYSEADRKVAEAFASLWAVAVQHERQHQAVEASESQYRRLVETLHDCVGEIDTEGRYTFMSSASERILGYAPGDIVGRSIGELVPPEDVPELMGTFRECAETARGVTEYPLTMVTPEGSPRHLELNARPITDADGRVSGFVGAARDVTERIAAQRALESQNRRLETLNLIATAVGSTLDIDDLVQRAMDAVVAVTGAVHGALHLYSPEGDALVMRARSGTPEMVVPPELDRLDVGDDPGGPALAFRSGEIVAEDLSERVQHLEPGSPLRNAVETLVHEQKLPHMVFVPLLARGRAIGIVCLCYAKGHEVAADDVKCLDAARSTIGVAIDRAMLYQANQQRAEELARANEELKSLDRMKNDFISLVGHELRTPLAGILGYAEFLAEEELSPEETHEFAAIIHRESERLTRLVNAVLDLNRMEAGRVEYHKVLEDLNDVVRVAVAAMEGAAGRRHQRLRLALTGDALTAEFDPDRIQQVLLNLLSNAVKFSPEQSEIEVGTRSDDGSVIAWVRDQGIGIDPEDMPRIFESFVQADHGRGRLEGSGLGLPICKGIVEGGHGGEIWAESPGPGGGATVYFRIPRHISDASVDR